MDVSINISDHSTKWQKHSEIKSSVDTKQNPEHSELTEDLFSPRDNLKVSFRHGGLSDTEIMEYFESNKDSNLHKENLKQLQHKLKDTERSDRSIFSQLHQLEGTDREADIRLLLHELEQARDLENLIFGESQDSEGSHDKSNVINFKFEVQFKKTEDHKKDLYMDISNASFLPRREADPLVLDLGNDGIQTTGIDEGIQFDLNGDNRLEKSSFAKGNDYALAIDKNQNGLIDSGKELFGDQNGSKDGIEELKSYDQNNDGKIDKKDSVFSSLLLVNADRKSKNLTQAGINSIDLKRLEKVGFTSSGDRIQDGLKVNMSDGSIRSALDVYFQYRK